MISPSIKSLMRILSSCKWSGLRRASITATTLFLLALLSRCSANWHLRKAISKDPAILQPKEVFLIDTLVVSEGIRVDTLAYFNTDTLTIERERLRVQIKRIHDTIRVTGECLPDTIRIVERVELPPRIKYVEKESKWLRMLLWIALAVAVLILGRAALDRLMSR